MARVTIEAGDVTDTAVAGPEDGTRIDAVEYNSFRPTLTQAIMTRPRLPFSPSTAIGALAVLVFMATPSQAQPKAKASVATASPSLVGTWTGTATVPLPDSSIVVPVIYTFTQTGNTIGGTAIVPGQGSGTISNVARDGARLQFRVTAPEGRLLEHDGKVGADGTIEGVVNMDNQPLAKFKISPKPAARPK